MLCGEAWGIVEQRLNKVPYHLSFPTFADDSTELMTTQKESKTLQESVKVHEDVLLFMKSSSAPKAMWVGGAHST